MYCFHVLEAESKRKAQTFIYVFIYFFENKAIVSNPLRTTSIIFIIIFQQLQTNRLAQSKSFFFSTPFFLRNEKKNKQINK